MSNNAAPKKKSKKGGEAPPPEVEKDPSEMTEGELLQKQLEDGTNEVNKYKYMYIL